MISIPECPPLSPDIFICIALPFVLSSLVTGSFPLVLIPPAQLTKRYPSSSLSRFINIFPLICSGETAIAPDIPVSSSVVIKTSNAGCITSSEASIAIA